MDQILDESAGSCRRHVCISYMHTGLKIEGPAARALPQPSHCNMFRRKPQAEAGTEPSHTTVSAPSSVRKLGAPRIIEEPVATRKVLENILDIINFRYHSADFRAPLIAHLKKTKESAYESYGIIEIRVLDYNTTLRFKKSIADNSEMVYTITDCRADPGPEMVHKRATSSWWKFF